MSPARLPYTASRKVSVVGPDQVTSPFPVRVAGTVIKGFGRGSKQLGFPTANLPLEVVEDLVVKLEGPGIYYGWAKVADSQVLPMVMSIGWNPYYQNEKPSAEIYIIHKFDQDFYGKELRAVILGFIRPELDYPSLGNISSSQRCWIDKF